jgi:hypothetical protein
MMPKTIMTNTPFLRRLLGGAVAGDWAVSDNYNSIFNPLGLRTEGAV